MVRKSLNLLMMLLIVCSCKRIITTACPQPTIFSQEFKDNLKRDLKENKSYFINEIVIDYFNLQEDLKLCNGVK